MSLFVSSGRPNRGQSRQTTSATVRGLQRRLKLSGVGIGQKWSNGILLASLIASAANQTCAPLGLVQVHHVLPFHYCVLRAGPTWSSTSETSLLCGKSHDGIGDNRHWWIGQLDNFQSSNLFVVRDARKTFFGTSRSINPR